MSQDTSFVWKGHWKWLGWASKWGRAGSQGITMVNSTVLFQLIQIQIWCPVSIWGRAQQSTNGFCQHFCLWESCLSSSQPKSRQFSFSSYVPWTLWVCLVSSHTGAQRKGVHQQESACISPLKGTCGTPDALCLTQQQSAGLHSQKLWGLVFPVLESWVGEFGEGLGPSLLKVNLHDSPHVPHDFYPPHMGVEPAHSASLPCLPVSYAFFFISSVVGLLFN